MEALGSGSYGTVYKAEKKVDDGVVQYAIKCISKKRLTRKTFSLEKFDRMTFIVSSYTKEVKRSML